VEDDDHVSSMKELVCDGRPDVADSPDQHAQRHEPSSARIVSFGSSPWWPVVALVPFCPWTEHHEARCEEQQSDEHDASAPHGQADDAGVDAWLIGDPRVLRATGRAHRGVASDQCRAQSAGDRVSLYFGHATTPSMDLWVVDPAACLDECDHRFLVDSVRLDTRPGG